jgi:hypothetical protein
MTPTGCTSLISNLQKPRRTIKTWFATGGCVGRGGLALVVLLPLVIPVGQADWLMVGGDAGHTGLVDSTGPLWDDIILNTQLPGLGPNRGGPLIIGRYAYTGTTNFTEWNLAHVSEVEDDRRINSTNMVWRIDLDTAQVEPFVSPPYGFVNIASDGELLFVQMSKGIQAYRLSDARPAWSEPWIPELGTTDSWKERQNIVCPSLRVVDGGLYGGCNTLARRGQQYLGTGIPPEPPPEVPIPPELRINDYTLNNLTEFPEGMVVRLNATTGEQLWRWDVIEGEMEDQATKDSTREGVVSPYAPYLRQLNVIGSTAVAVVESQAGDDGVCYVRVLALNAVDGKPLWHTPSPPGTCVRQMQNEADLGPDVDERVSVPQGTFGQAYLKWGPELCRMDLATGDRSSCQPIHDEDRKGQDWAVPVIIREDAVIVPTINMLRRLHPVTLDRIGEVAALRPIYENESWTKWNAAAGDVFFLTSAGVRGEKSVGIGGLSADQEYMGTTQDYTVRAYSADTLRQLWVHPMPEAFLSHHGRFGGARLAVSGGVLVAAGYDGQLKIFGTSQASPRVSLTAPGSVAPGESFSIDLSSSGPGTRGEVTAYRAIWGDESVTDWHVTPQLKHTYVEPGTFEARFQVRSALGQTASLVHTFEVREQDPEATILGLDSPVPASSKGFGAALAFVASPVGLLLSALLILVLVLIILLLMQRRRTRLAREIAYAERAFARVRGDATAERAVLADRRSRAGRLLLRSKLTSSEHAILIGRIVALETTISGDATGELIDFAPGVLVLNKFRIRKPLGEGAFGRTFLAQDELVGREVVLKVLRERLPESAIREARAIGGIRHPNVITLFDVSRAGDHTFLVMEYAEGGSLRQRLQHGHLTPAQFSSVATGLLAALSAVHAAGAVHRDIKPSNVLLDGSGTAKLADFGIARAPGTDRTRSGIAMHLQGTLRYMAPEQARGRAANTSSDLYSAALTLFEAWTGRPYVEAAMTATEEELRVVIASTGPFAAPVGPGALRDWFAKGLDPQPEGRFSSADAMLAAFTAAWATWGGKDSGTLQREGLVSPKHRLRLSAKRRRTALS